MADVTTKVKAASTDAYGTVKDPVSKAYVDQAIAQGGYVLPAATKTTLGGVKVGSNLSVTADGTVSATDTKYTLPAATKTTLGGVKVGSNLSVTADGTVSATDTKYTLPAATKTKLGGVMPDNTTVATTSTGVLSVKDGGITSAKLADGAVTAGKIADGAITSDKLASGVGGGGSLGDLHQVDYAEILSVVTFDVGNFTMYLVTVTASNAPAYLKAFTSSLTSSVLTIAPDSTSTTHVVYGGTQSASFTLTWWDAKSTSARAALATLLPVQDECEAMAAEIKQAEQDWIDNPDETVAVDGNGVPIAIVNKKAELATKQAELEKLREDYFSKLGDWKNEVQE